MLPAPPLRLLDPSAQNGHSLGVSDRENEVWNRAAFGGGTAPEAGDVALAALLRVHSRAMSGGLLDALEYTTAEEFSAAVNSYREFGLDAAAEVLEDVRSRIEDGLNDDDADALEADADDRYGAVIADDEVIVSAFPGAPDEPTWSRANGVAHSCRYACWTSALRWCSLSGWVRTSFPSR